MYSGEIKIPSNACIIMCIHEYKWFVLPFFKAKLVYRFVRLLSVVLDRAYKEETSVFMY